MKWGYLPHMLKSQFKFKLQLEFTSRIGSGRAVLVVESVIREVGFQPICHQLLLLTGPRSFFRIGDRLPALSALRSSRNLSAFLELVASTAFRLFGSSTLSFRLI